MNKLLLAESLSKEVQKYSGDHTNSTITDNKGAVIAIIIGSFMLVTMIGMFVWKRYFSDPSRQVETKA